MLKVSPNRRYLIHDDGSPFFYLADTAWELFHRCSRPEAELYLRDRAAKRFTVIQAVVLAELDGLHTPNPYGQKPLQNDDPSKPNEAYFEHVDYVVNLAEALGLTIGMLPTWGDKWNKKWGDGPEIFTPENARGFGLYLGHRYARKPILWILGGDRPVENDTHRAVIKAMAEGLRAGDGGQHLITLHPTGGQTSAQFFHDEPWLDFNMYQTGHVRNRDCYKLIESDYKRTPVKPCLDGEPGYEDHPSAFSIDNGYLDDYDCRKYLYWDLFAGACGHTYGCHPIWQMLLPGRNPLSVARRPWTEALHLPGSGQMRHARALLESRPYLTRIPDQSLLASDPGGGSSHVQATRDEAGSYALIYCASAKPVTVDLEKLTGRSVAAHWFDPRTGAAQRVGEYPRAGKREFTPPPIGQDWVLCLEDPAKKYPAPGEAVWSGNQRRQAAPKRVEIRLRTHRCM